jgi:hypothetical protein
MEKKKYETPDMKVYDLKVNPKLLAGSGEEEED